MRSHQFLLVVAAVQGVLLAALMTLIVLNRWFRVRRRAALSPRRAAIEATLQRWQMGEPVLPDVVRGLGALPVPVAIDVLIAWASRVSGERWSELAEALRGELWAKLLRADASSARWWKRLDCARFLSVVATPHDVVRVRRLLLDPNPAVHIAAVATLERLHSPTLTAAAMQKLPQLTPTVHAYYANMLRRARSGVVDVLRKELRASGGAGLARYAEFAARLEDPSLREPLTALGAHPEADVRVQVARGLGGFPHAESVSALRRLIADTSWEVRAQAARSLGRIADPATLPLLVTALGDDEWWVRMRAALALTRLGPSGRDALLKAEVGALATGRDMARLILGLAPQALAEFAR
ncbi:MAG TPA: HEAT repeat domain-containing protein [Gemmatimonadales bacterium]